MRGDENRSKERERVAFCGWSKFSGRSSSIQKSYKRRSKARKNLGASIPQPQNYRQISVTDEDHVQNMINSAVSRVYGIYNEEFRKSHSWGLRRSYFISTFTTCDQIIFIVSTLQMHWVNTFFPFSTLSWAHITSSRSSLSDLKPIKTKHSRKLR